MVIFIRAIHIAKEDLVRLYINEEISTNNIAKQFNCSKALILKKLHNYEIKTRMPGRRRVLTDVEELKKHYLEEKLATRKIAAIYRCSRSSVHRKLKQYKIRRRCLAEAEIKYPRQPFSGDLDEKAYMIGFALGDLRVRQAYKNGQTIGIACSSSRMEQIRLIQSLFSPYGRIWIKRKDRGAIEYYHIEAYVDLSFSFLLRKKENLSWIGDNPAHFLHFFAGFTDAEGSFFITAGKAGYSLGNYDLEILEFIKTNLQKYFAIPAKIHVDRHLRIIQGGYRRNDYYKQLVVYRRADLVALINILEDKIRHEKRLNALKLAERHILRGDTLPSQKSNNNFSTTVRERR